LSDHGVYFHVWNSCRQTLRKLLVLVLVDLYLWLTITTPAHAFIISSSTGYSRVITAAAQTAHVSANRTQVINAIATGVNAASAGSLVVRAVTGPVGWASLAVAGGLVLYQMLYDQTERDTIKQNASVAAGNPSNIVVAGAQPWNTGAAGSSSTLSGCSPLTNPCTQTVIYVTGTTVNNCFNQTGPPAPSGWTRQSPGWDGQCKIQYNFTYTGNPAPLASNVADPPTVQQIQDYMTSLPSSNPLAPEQQKTAVGTLGTPQTGTSSTTDIPVSPTQIGSNVIPSNNGQTGDAVVNPNEPPPQQTTQQQTQQTTTATTTNPDGSTTDTEQASVQCAAGSHNQKSFGQVLNDHITVWNSSGLVGTLNLIKNITWPTTFPTYTLNSGILGTINFDFNAWSGTINALRTIVIAGAGFAAYRIIFAGGS
jgi:hypothetical protein